MRATRKPRIVALGGGHGLAASLEALRLVTDSLTAVVTVADDGGSSGRLREELGVLPPGDLRMALAALCDHSTWGSTWRDLLQHRYDSEGPLHDHATGNLLIVALWELLGDPVEGLDLVARLLNAHGRVLPMSKQPLVIEATVSETDEDGAPITRTVRGQHNVALLRSLVTQVRLDPEDAPACPEAVEALSEADWIILGPGSWYSSVMPHLLLPDLRDAIIGSKARRCVTLNLAPEDGETYGLTAEKHLDALHAHAPELSVDVVIADPSSVGDITALESSAQLLGAQLLLRQVRVGDGTARHDPLRLAAAYRDVIDGFLSDVGIRSR